MKKISSLLVMSICLIWGLPMTLVAQDNVFRSPQLPNPLIYARENPLMLLDTPEIIEKMDEARELAGDEYSLVTNQLGQCRDFDDTFTLWNRPKYEDDNAVPTQVFDNVYYVGVKAVGGWVFDTGDGLIMLDSNYANQYDTLIQNFGELGLNPADVKYIMITHSGPDHIGAIPAWTADYPDVKIYTDTDTALRMVQTGTPEENLMIVTEVESSFKLGDTKVRAYITPRRVNGGGLSFIIPVWVDGKRHKFASFGNTGAPPSLDEKALWLDSINLFSTYVKKYQADIALSSHPFVDGSLEYMRIIRECDERPHHHEGWNRKECRKNPLVLGKKLTRRYFKIMANCAEVLTMRQEANLELTGVGCAIGYEYEVNPAGIGTCVEIVCEDGYEMNPQTGVCMEQVVCDEDGYEIHPKTGECVEECEEGYKRHGRTGDCVAEQ